MLLDNPNMIVRKRFDLGPMLRFLKIFSPKNSAEKIGIMTQNKAKSCQILIMILVFEKNANFFAENCQKSQTIVIITSTPEKTFAKWTPGDAGIRLRHLGVPTSRSGGGRLLRRVVRLEVPLQAGRGHEPPPALVTLVPRRLGRPGGAL
jgi:hypothetical protein